MPRGPRSRSIADRARRTPGRGRGPATGTAPSSSCRGRPAGPEGGELGFELDGALSGSSRGESGGNPVVTLEVAPGSARGRELADASDSDVMPTMADEQVRRPPAAPALENVTVPGYDILGELGRGGMGVVVPGPAPPAAAAGRPEDGAIRRARGGRRPVAVPRRGRGGRQALASEYRPDLRDRRTRRAAVLLARAGRRGQPRPADSREPDEPAGGRAARRDAVARHGGGARARDRPPRPQAGEYPAGREGSESSIIRSRDARFPRVAALGPLVAERGAEDHRLRPGEAGGRRLEPDADRDDPRARPATWPPSRPAARTARSARRPTSIRSAPSCTSCSSAGRRSAPAIRSTRSARSSSRSRCRRGSSSRGSRWTWRRSA